MAWSPKTIIKLSQLARVMKKDFNIATNLSQPSSIANLLLHASKKSHHKKVTELYNNYRSTATTDDEAMVKSVNLSLDAPATLLKPDGLKRMYRGQSIQTKESSISAESNTEYKEKEVFTYRGQQISTKEPDINVENKTEHKQKRIGTYRGQPIYK